VLALSLGVSVGRLFYLGLIEVFMEANFLHYATGQIINHKPVHIGQIIKIQIPINFYSESARVVCDQVFATNHKLDEIEFVVKMSCFHGEFFLGWHVLQ
jgi:hypothetical protein